MLGDLVVKNHHELYSTTDVISADQSATSVRTEEAVSAGDVDAMLVGP